MKKIYNFLVLATVMTVTSFASAQNCDEPEDAGCGRASGDYTWYWYDDDGDGVGNNGGTVDDGECFLNTPTAPEGFSATCGDCNDNDATTQYEEYFYIDVDRDGYGTGNPILSCSMSGFYTSNNNSDCDDTDKAINPLTKWYRDADGDNAGDPNNYIRQCEDPSTSSLHYVLNSDDCDDTDVNTTFRIFYRDSDGDGYGVSSDTERGCAPPTGYVDRSGDCDDSRPEINPETRWYVDNDGDGFGNHNGQYIEQCTKPIGYVFGEPDCNDNNAGIHPNTIWYYDANNDGYGDSAEDYKMQCTKPNGYVLLLSPIQPVASEPLPTYGSLDLNDLTYKQSTVPLQAVTTLSALLGLPQEQRMEQKTYYDGLGRPMQQVAIQQGGYQEDILQYIEYDRFGRTVKKYLPYARKQGTSTGRYRSNAKNETASFYQDPSIQNGYASTNNPFSESVFERSPLNRGKRQSSPGNSWSLESGHEVELDYKLNVADDVRRFKVSLSTSLNPTLVDDGSYYTANELAISIVKDEDWVSGVNNTMEEYKNKEGLVILKRTFVDGIRLSTYYVYDDFNNLTYVIPPKAEADSNTITPAILNKLCFQYKYDGLRRQIAKSKPDVMGWERVIYDSEDRPILVKDPNIGAQGKWLFTKYDKFGRVAYTGFYAPPNSRTPEELQVDVDDLRLSAPQQPHNEKRGTSTIGGVTIGYTNDAFPNTNLELLTVSYYDDYNFLDPDKPTLPTSVFNEPVTTNVKGMPVANWSRTLGASTWNKSYSYYNEKGTILRSYNKNHLGGYTQVDTEVDYRQKPLQSMTKHKRISSDAEMTITDRFVYDQNERIKASYQKINNSPEKLINGFVYNAMGQLLVKYIEPESEDFGYEMVEATKSEEKETFTSEEIPGRIELNSEKGTSLEIKNKKLHVGLEYDGTGVLGYYELEANKEYTFAFNVSFVNFTANLDFGISFGSTQLHSQAITNSGTVETTFTPSQTGTYTVSLIMSGNTSGTQQTFTLDNSIVQEKLAGLPLVQQLKDINALQTIDYKYNARGSLTYINDPDSFGQTRIQDDIFAYKVNYDLIENQNGTTNKTIKPYYNGNISQVKWVNISDFTKHTYTYTYDALNRIKKAVFSDTNYNLDNVDYDKNGNITNLERSLYNGKQNFNYNYTDGNQLQSLGGTETIGLNINPVSRNYSYDANGNLKTDDNKGISDIEYNYLNQPERVTFTTGEVIEYDYEASGVKLQKRFIDGNTTYTTDYINGFQYLDGILQFLGQAEGYVVHTLATNGTETNEYVYNFTDHLGNIRLSYSDTNGDGHILANEIVKENNYYPFGMLHKDYGAPTAYLGSVFNYGFSGKELQEENQIAWLDFGSRNYDAELGRWFNTDPQNQFGSPYLYAFNNPISSVDPDGEFAFLLAIGIGATIGAVTEAITNPSADLASILRGAAIGGFTAAATYGIGQFGGGELLSAGLHGSLQGGLAASQGGNFWSSAVTGAVSSGVASSLKYSHPTVQIGGSAVVGGFVSEFQGGKFSEGFVTGLTVSAFNHAMHRAAIALQKTKTAIAGFYGAGHSRGTDNTENGVLKEFVEEKGGKMFGWGNREIDKAVDYLKKASNKGKRIEIYGHSRGGNAAVHAANKLGESNVLISKLVLFDAHILWDNYHFVLTGGNVREVHNYYQNNPRTGKIDPVGILGTQFGPRGSNPYWGSKIIREHGTLFNPGYGIYNYNLTGKYFAPGRPISHLNIVRYGLKNGKL